MSDDRFTPEQQAIDEAKPADAKRCVCCERTVSQTSWDWLYSACHDCAHCQSLEHYPCHHGKCQERPCVRADEIERFAEELRGPGRSE